MLSGQRQQRAVLAEARSGRQLRRRAAGRDFAEEHHEITDPKLFLGMPLRREDREIVFQPEPVAADVPFHELWIAAAERGEPMGVRAV